MSTDEISIRRCTWLLSQRGFKSWREDEIGYVLALQSTRPDFLVETAGGIRFFLELKSFEKDTILKEMEANTFIFLSHMSLQKRASRLVKDAAAQLLPYAPEALPMVVALDNHRKVGIALDAHTLGSLFGDLEKTITMDETTAERLDDEMERKDDGSPLAAGRNPHISAVLALEPVVRFDTLEAEDDFSRERPMKVRILRNPMATVPFPTGIFTAIEDEILNDP